MVGNESFIKWDDFTKNSTEVVKTIDEMNRLMAIFREIQHKNFIQTSTQFFKTLSEKIKEPWSTRFDHYS